MFRRGAEITKRLRRGAGHNMPGVVDGRLPRQFLAVRAARDLREHSGAGRPQWLADGPEARRASVSDETGGRRRHQSMRAMRKLPDSYPTGWLPPPSFSIAGLAGTSFK